MKALGEAMLEGREVVLSALEEAYRVLRREVSFRLWGLGFRV